MKQENQGFTLVELVVSIAILAIGGAAMIGFFAFVLTHYQKTTEDTNLQYEVQLVQNRLEEQILQTNVGARISADQKKLYLYSKNADTQAVVRTTYYLEDGNLLYLEESQADEKQPGRRI